MSADSTVLLEEAIQRLEALAEILSREANVQRSAPQELSPDERTRKEIGLSIRVLLPKLHSVRLRDALLPRGRVCMSCED